jgi:3-phosphoshikimate 1-carboxyvinyltransferase
LRFLLSLASIAQGSTTFEAHERMGERPIDDLLHALRALGVDAEQHAGAPRYVVAGGRLLGGSVAISGVKSSQFLSSLLMVAPYAEGDVEIRIEGRQTSQPYVDMTLAVMHSFGIEVQNSQYEKFAVKAGSRYRTSEYFVEPDASGASYFLAAAGIAGGEVAVRGFRRSSLQGDAQFASVLERMGCRIVEGVEGVKICCDRGLRGIEIDMNSMPDVVPTLAAAALFAQGETRIRNVAQLRFKESDRLNALVEELGKLGADISVRDDGLIIRPSPLHGARLDTYDDHRLAMSFSLVGLRVPGVQVENPGCVKKSFPTYWNEFAKLYPGATLNAHP